MPLSVLGLGTAVPEHVMLQTEAALMSQELTCRNRRQSRLMSAMFRHSAVKTRHTCVPHRTAYGWIDEDRDPPGTSSGPSTAERMQMYDDHAGPLAFEAADGALRQASIAPSGITHLITVSCTGFEAPGVDVSLIQQLGLPASTQRLHIGFMGCHGAVNGLRAAQALAERNPDHRILMCAVELCSLHYRFRWDDERILGNVLFADGAAAIVARSSDESMGMCRVLETGSCLLPDSTQDITWSIGDFGFEMTLSPDVSDHIRKGLKPWLSGWLADRGHTLDSIRHWVIHPGGPRILTAVEEALELDRSRTIESRRVLEAFGNMSSPTVLFILERQVLRGLEGPCVALAFGPGIVAEAALIDRA